MLIVDTPSIVAAERMCVEGEIIQQAILIGGAVSTSRPVCFRSRCFELILSFKAGFYEQAYQRAAPSPDLQIQQY